MLWSNHSIIKMETMASCWSSSNLSVIQTLHAHVGLASTCQNMSFVEPIKIFITSRFKDLFRQGIYAFVSKNKCIGLSDSWNNLSLLCLIIQNRNFLIFFILELPTKQRVTSCNCYDFRILVGNYVGYSWTRHQHCSVWNFLITLQGIFTVFWNHVKFH